MATKQFEVEGFKFEVDMTRFDDVEFFEIIDKLDTNPKLHIDLAKMAMGEDGYKAFADYFKKRDGKLKMSVLMRAVEKIFEEADPKDSASGSSAKSTQKN